MGFFCQAKNKARCESSVSTAVIVRDLPDALLSATPFLSLLYAVSSWLHFHLWQSKQLKNMFPFAFTVVFEGIFHLLGLFLSDSSKSNIGLTIHAVPPTYLPTTAHAPTLLRKDFHYYQCFFLYKE